MIGVIGEGYAPEGMFTISGSKIDPQKNEALLLLLNGAVLCNNAHIEKKNMGYYRGSHRGSTTCDGCKSWNTKGNARRNNSKN